MSTNEEKRAARVKTVEGILADTFKTYRSKNSDYAGEFGPDANFEYAASVSEPFSDPVDKVFAVMIGIKLARLAVLKRPGKVPNNESVVDSHKDLTTYCVIWAARESEK